MIAVSHLFEVVLKHYNIALEDHDSWSLIAADMHFRSYDKDELLCAISRVYPKVAQTNPGLPPLLDDLFMKMALDTIQNALEKPLEASKIENIFSVWTHCGTRDLPERFAQPLARALKRLPLEDYSKHINRVVFRKFTNVLVNSPILWTFFKNDLLRTIEHFTGPQGISYALLSIAHRYSPNSGYLESFSKDDIANMYEKMCGNHLDTKPTLQSLRNVLTGYHNNVLAWDMALAICAPEDPTIAGNWMHMSETFSALRLEPKDQDSWRFWHSLCECCASDASGSELLSFLVITQKRYQEFGALWSLVDTLYEGNERYARAVQMYNPSSEFSEALPLPYSDA